MKTSPNHTKTVKRNGFTLVELLVVIAIIGILLTVAATGIKSMSGGRGTTTGLSIIGSLVEEARATAESRGETVLLLINNEYIPRDDTENQAAADNYLRQLFLGVRNEDTGNVRVISKGTLLPVDTYFNKELSESGGATFPANDLRVSLPSAIDSSNSDCIAYEFDSSGRLVSPVATGDNHARIVLSGGVLNRTAGNATLIMTGAASNDHEGIVIWKSGRTSQLRDPEQISEDSKTRFELN